MRKIELIGNVCKAPETRETAKGSVCHFDLADFVTPEKSDFYSISAWGKQGESCQKYLDKGRKVYVRGDLSATIYTSKGQPKIQLNVNASEVEFLSPAEKTETKPQKKTKENSDGYDQTPDDWATINSSDLPF